MAIQPPPQATAPEFFPIAPARTEDSGLPVARLADLLLKHIYFKSPMSAKDWAGALCLPYQTVTPAIQSLVEQGWAQTIGRMAGPSQSPDFGGTLGCRITAPGRLRARDVLARDHYVGPAPVPFAQYDVSVRTQVSQADVTAAWLTRALQHLTLSPDLLVQLGPPVNARAPLFLYGAPGNRKTTIAEALAARLAQPPDRRAGAADRLPHAGRRGHGGRRALRGHGRVQHQPRAGIAGRRSVSPARALQDPRARSDSDRIPADLRTGVQGVRDRVQRGRLPVRARSVLQAVQAPAARLPAARHPQPARRGGLFSGPALAARTGPDRPGLPLLLRAGISPPADQPRFRL